MKEVKIDKGLLRMSRNLGILGTTGFVLFSAGFMTGTIEVVSPSIKYVASGGLLLSASIVGSLTYNIHKQLKKLK